jgi:hypothetical protein
VVLPEHLAGLFGDLAVTTPVTRVPEVLADLWSDRDAARDRASRGQELTRERFGHGVHQRRVEALLVGTDAPHLATGSGRRADAEAVSGGTAPVERADGRPGRELRRRRVLAIPVGGDGGALDALAAAAERQEVELLTCRGAGTARSAAPAPAGPPDAEVLPTHLGALSSADRRRVLGERIGDLIDELDLSGVMVVDPHSRGAAGGPPAQVSGEELTTACQDARRSRPHVTTTRWDGAVSERPGSGATTADDALHGLLAVTGRDSTGASAQRLQLRLRHRLRLRVRELAELLWARLPESTQLLVERARARRAGSPVRIAVPGAGMLSEAEVRIATGMAVVLRGKAAGAEARATVEALRRHQLVHRDVLPLLVCEPGTEPAAWSLGYPTEVLPDGVAGISRSDRQRRRLALLRTTYDITKLLVLEAPEDLEDPVVRASLEHGEG